MVELSIDNGKGATNFVLQRTCASSTNIYTYMNRNDSVAIPVNDSSNKKFKMEHFHRHFF